MNTAARIRLATILTFVLIAALITAGLLVRGSAGGPATQQPVARVTAPAPQPAALAAPTVATPSLTVAGEDGEGFDDD